MKKILGFLLFLIGVTSCSTYEYDMTYRGQVQEKWISKVPHYEPAIQQYDTIHDFFTKTEQGKFLVSLETWKSLQIGDSLFVPTIKEKKQNE